MTDLERRELQDLREEQTRLRSEIDRMRQEQQKPKEEKSKEEKPKDDKPKEDKPDQDKKQEKPPLRRRAIDWIHKHPLLTIAIIAGLVILLIAGYFFWQYLESYETTDDAEVSGHIDQISPRISGTVVGVYVENSQGVVRGQTVVDLDPRDYQVALEQARANYSQAVSSLEAQNPNVPITQTTQATSVANAKSGVASAEAALIAAQRSYESSVADLEQAQANAANADAEEKRYAQLVTKQEVSRELYDQRVTTARADAALVRSRQSAAEASRRAVEEREASLNEARQNLEQAEKNLPRQIAVQHSTVAARRANVEAAKAQVDQAALNLSYCKIAAPIAGIVGDKTIELGMQVAPGQEMFAVTGTEDIWVTANFKETSIRKMHPGQSVTISVDALSQKFDGYIENMPGATGAQYSLLPPENATGNYVKVVQRLPVRIRFKKGQKNEDRLRPGMSVEPKVWVE